MRLLIDEQLSPAVAEQLRTVGQDVVTATEVGLGSLDDARVLAWAVSDRRAVVTNNIKDFRPLHATYLATNTVHYGIVLVPSGKYSFKRNSLGSFVTALDHLLRQHPADNAFCDIEYFL